MNILRQIQRGLKSAGFWCGLVLLLFTLQFVHMDASLYWKNPLAYFGSGDFFYTFIISIHVGILRFLFPLCALLPAGMMYTEDKESRFIIPTLHRQSPAKYVICKMASAVILSAFMVALAITLTTVFYLIVCPATYKHDSFQLAAMNGAYGWRAAPEHFAVFVVEAAARLMLSAAFWSFIALAFSGIWQNKVFVLVATLVFAYTLESLQLKFDAYEWTISFVQAPDVTTQTPLWIPFLRQLAYVISGALICYTSLRCSVSSKVQRFFQRIGSKMSQLTNKIAPPQHLLMTESISGTWLGQLWADFRAFFSPATIVCTLAVTAICVVMSSVFSFTKYSIGELLLGTFGGISWADPQLDFYGIGKWVLLLLPPMMGVAYNLEREIASRKLITVYRYGDVNRWWRSKALSTLLFSVLTVCLMFLTAIIIGLFSGAKGFTIYITDEDGFSVLGKGILPVLFLQFGLQVIMLTQLQVLFHAVTGDMKIGVLAYLVPLLAQLVSCSNVEEIRNIWMPVNWGMIMRSSIFCSNGYTMDSGEWLPLCAVDPHTAILLQLTAVAAIYLLHRIIVPRIKHKSK